MSEDNRNSCNWQLCAVFYLFFKDTKEEQETEKGTEVYEKWDRKERDESRYRGPAEVVFAEKSYWESLGVERD